MAAKIRDRASVSRRVIGISLTILALLLIVAGLWKPLIKQYHNYLVSGMFVTKAPTELAIGPALHTHFPGLQASNLEAPVTLLEPYSGSAGTLLIILRSIKGSPYCAQQLRQLQHHHAQFSANGVSIIALTQDDPSDIQGFTERYSPDITLLYDQQQLTVKTLGLLSSNSVIPGALIIGPDNRVRDKVFMADPHMRLESTALLTRAVTALSQEQP